MIKDKLSRYRAMKAELDEEYNIAEYTKRLNGLKAYLGITEDDLKKIEAENLAP